MAPYVNQLQANGARVVPLVSGWDIQVTEKLLPQINGILLPGNGPNAGDGYFEFAEYLLDRAVEINDSG